MIYIVTGKLLSLESYFLYFSICHSEPLKTIENLFGWFLLEHVFEQYYTTPGKLFIVYEDFRTLMSNVLLIARNIFFVAQFFTEQEFFLVNFILILSVIINKNKLKFNKFKIFVIFIYLNVLNSFLFLSVFHILISFILSIFVYLICFCVFHYLFLVYYCSFVRLTNKNLFNLYFKITLIKLFILIIIFVGCLFICLWYLNLYAKISDNFVQEFIIKHLIIYFYKYNITKLNLS